MSPWPDSPASAPVEILRWGEYAARDAADLAGIDHSVKLMAESWGVDLAAAMNDLADGYRHGAWPEEQTALLETQRWLATKLIPIKDDIIVGLRRSLVLAEDNCAADVVLVRHSYDLIGAHSHPALVDTSRFVGTDLVEALFHEVGHELLDRNIGQHQSGIAILTRALGTEATSHVTVYDLLHVLLFALVGNLVRKYFDQEHRPLLYRGDRFARMLQKMRILAPQADVIAVLDRHSAGQIELAELAQFFTDYSAHAMPLT